MSMLDVSKEGFIWRLSRLHHASTVLSMVSELAYLTFGDEGSYYANPAVSQMILELLEHVHLDVAEIWIAGLRIKPDTETESKETEDDANGD